jgi:2'-5' RNA ligase
MRAFVGLWPPPEIVTALATPPRPEVPGVRWTTAGQWHVTLDFLGEIAQESVGPLTASLRRGVAGTGPVTVGLGPATVLVGSGVLALAVRGLDGLAETVRRATGAVTGPAAGTPDPAGLPPPGPPRQFLGHLTLARPRGRSRRVPDDLAEGQWPAASWVAREVALVRSELGKGGARYETEATVPLL